MKILKMPQGTEEWLDARRPYFTASALGVWVATDPKKWTAKQKEARETAILKKVKSRLALEPEEEHYKNAVMQRGNDLEPEAKIAFMRKYMVSVEEVGFCISDDGIFGCSPDGFIGETTDHMLEIKCPTFEKYYRISHGDKLYQKYVDSYKVQLHMQMAVTGAKSVHFWQYYPGLRPLELVIQRDETTELVLSNLKALSYDTLEIESEIKNELSQ